MPSLQARSTCRAWLAAVDNLPAALDPLQIAGQPPPGQPPAGLDIGASEDVVQVGDHGIAPELDRGAGGVLVEHDHALDARKDLLEVLVVGQDLPDPRARRGDGEDHTHAVQPILGSVALDQDLARQQLRPGQLHRRRPCRSEDEQRGQTASYAAQR